MLDTLFPRPLGDVGHPGTWAASARMRVVVGVGPGHAVRTADGLRAGPVLSAFGAAARELEDEGAEVITTSCGFLVLLQRELQEQVNVPLVTSSLLQLPGLLAVESRVGVLTISAAKLGDDYLLAAGVPHERMGDVVVQGVEPGGEFASAILGNRETMDLRRAGAEVVAAARALQARAPDLRSVVLECTNMPPYADAVRQATGFELRSLLDDPALRLCVSGAV
ncbi:MAG: aspartate/glutamate racemase family protein [Ramlibacter sp.]